MTKRCDRCKKDWPGYMWCCPKCGIVLGRPDLEAKAEDEQLTIEVLVEERDDQDSVCMIVPGTEDLIGNW